MENLRHVDISKSEAHLAEILLFQIPLRGLSFVEKLEDTDDNETQQ